MSTFWNNWIIAIVAINIIGVLWLLVWTSKQSPEDVAETETCGHSYDGIEEYNQPLPRWWLNLFYIMIAVAIAYLILFPGLGNYDGTLGWTSEKQWDNEILMAENKYSAIYAEYAKVPVEELLNYDEPLKVGQNLFANNCALCHGTDAKGTKGFPNLTDADWLYGGSPEAIKSSILQGRVGNMPAFENAFSSEQISALTNYVSSLSNTGAPVSELASIEQGKTLFASTCAACHGANAQGTQALGAPNLTDNIWLYGGTKPEIEASIIKGRQGNMPSHSTLLGEEKSHVIAAYVYSLANPKQPE